MITLNNLTMGFTQRTLFQEVTLSIFPNEKIGLTGPNGAGKTTLFHIIRGEMEPVAGEVSIQKNINIGYLAQEAQYDSKRTVMDEMTRGDARVAKLLEEKRRMEDAHQADRPRYGDILEELEVLGIYDLEHKAEKILLGLGFKEEDFHRPVCELSGGWQMRTLLAKLLNYPYDILLLDEPTNYLDLNATLWLKEYLKGYDGAFVLISHDRVFLNDVTNYTIILEGAQMAKVKGNYESYEQQKELQFKSLEKKQKVLEQKRKQLERFTQRFHAQPNRASAVRNKRKVLERMEQVDLPQDYHSAGDFEFEDIAHSGYVVAQVKNVHKAYDEKVVYKGLDLEIIRNQKVCLVGPNGAGKSTLLKMLAGVVTPDSGEIRYGQNVDVGYFSQSRIDVLHPENTALDEVFGNAPKGTPNVKARSLLGLFNFHGDDVFKRVKVLSGGEKSRLILARLLINPPNFMLLDEPTTHLDLDGIKALTGAFKKFQGTVCFISHDLYFIQEIADAIIDVEPGSLKIYPGGLDYYMDKKSGKLDGLDGSGTMTTKSMSQKASEVFAAKKPKKKESSKVGKLHEEHQKAVQRLANIRKEIKSLEQERDELEKESYVKSRVLSRSYEQRDQERIKTFGKRLKEIQTRLREIETRIKELAQERDSISK